MLVTSLGQFCWSVGIILPKIWEKHGFRMLTSCGWLRNLKKTVENDGLSIPRLKGFQSSKVQPGFRNHSQNRDENLGQIWQVLKEWISGWWLGHPSEKYESDGISLPNIWENAKNVPQTTNQNEIPHHPCRFLWNPDNITRSRLCIAQLSSLRRGYLQDGAPDKWLKKLWPMVDRTN